METVTSYGVIPLRIIKNQWEVLLIQHQAGHWSFPKGHAEANESPLEAAQRELQEETGLDVQRILVSEPLSEQYFFTTKGYPVSKTVFYFPALVEGNVSIQASEIKSYGWFSIKEAWNHLTFDESKRVIEAFEEILSKMYIKLAKK